MDKDGCSLQALATTRCKHTGAVRVSENLTTAENHLALAIVDWLKSEVSFRLDEHPGPRLLYDMAQSNFEGACSALERAGQLSREGGSWRILWDETAETCLPEDLDRSALDQLLDALICQWAFVAGNALKNGPVFETEGNFRFESHGLLRNVGRCLAACGYAIFQDSGEASWTNQAAPWLVRHDVWDLMRFDPSNDEVIEQVIRKIPPRPLEWLSGPNGTYQSAFARRLFASWFEGAWHDNVWREHPSGDWDLPLATALYLRLQ